VDLPGGPHKAAVPVPSLVGLGCNQMEPGILAHGVDRHLTKEYEVRSKEKHHLREYERPRSR
jgi:hypothetical protein